MKTTISGSTVFSGKVSLKRILLICGILSSLLYVGTDILAAFLWKDYSYTSQTVSELIAIDAPTRPLVVPLFIMYSLLVYAFGVGVWQSSGQKRALRFASVGIVGKEILGLVVTIFSPIHLRGVEGTLTDTMHITLTGVGVFLFMFPALGFGAAAVGKHFRLYSIATMMIFIVFGVLTFIDGSRISVNLPTPLIGVWERINIYGYMLWIVVLAIILLRTEKESGSIKATMPDQTQL